MLLDVENFSGDRRKLTGGTRIRGFKNKTRRRFSGLNRNSFILKGPDSVCSGLFQAQTTAIVNIVHESDRTKPLKSNRAESNHSGSLLLFSLLSSAEGALRFPLTSLTLPR